LKIRFIICMALTLALLASPAWAGCGKWVVRDNTDFLKDDVFDDAVASSTGSSATVNSDGTPIAKNETNAENKAAVSSAPNSTTSREKKAADIDLAGKWEVRLNNGQADQSAEKAMNLILIQSGDRLQGYGTILEEGADIPATATGSISQDGISLDIKLTQQKKDYRLDMALVKNELLGSYELFDTEILRENGNATASRSS
jgi:hypothetical protein